MHHFADIAYSNFSEYLYFEKKNTTVKLKGIYTVCFISQVHFVHIHVQNHFTILDSQRNWGQHWQCHTATTNDQALSRHAPASPIRKQSRSEPKRGRPASWVHKCSCHGDNQWSGNEWGDWRWWTATGLWFYRFQISCE